MKIALVVYKIEADRGSEDGSGYMFASTLASRFDDLTIITRTNNVPALLRDPAFRNTRIIGVDVPRYLGFYKKKARGIILYYYIWQIFVGRLLRRIQRVESFDIVHHFNFHTDWAPHFLSNSGGSLIWGPVAHHERVPADFMNGSTLSSRIAEWARYLTKQLFWRFDPFLRAAVRRSDVVIYGNGRLAPPFAKAGSRVHIRPYATSKELTACSATPTSSFQLLTVGRLIPLKGFWTTLDAFHAFLTQHPESGAELIVIGNGSLERKLKAHSQWLNIADNVRFVGWLPQAQLVHFYADASAFVFPSFEAQGLVVAEAMAAGLPVICLEQSGPASVAGDSAITVPRADYATTIRLLSDRISMLWSLHQQGAPYVSMRDKIRHDHEARLTPDRLADDIIGLYSASLKDRIHRDRRAPLPNDRTN